MSLIEVRELTKSYGRSYALRRLSFTVARSERLCLVGQNGAGKSTLLRCVAGLVRPDEGHVLIDGIDLRDSRNFTKVKRTVRLGLMTQSSFFYEALSLRENLELAAGMSIAGDPKARVTQLAEELAISSSLHKRFDECSQGIGRRAAFARAVVHEPNVLLLDEPMANLDANGCMLVSNVITRLALTDTTILIATHEKRVIEQHCNRVLVLEDGRLAEDQSPTEFLAQGIALAG